MQKFLSSYRQEIRSTLTLSLPIIVGQLGHMLMALFDNAMVGRLGPAALAAAGTGNAVYFLVIVIGIGIMTSVSALVSISNARGEYDVCGQYLKYSFVVAFITTLFATAVLVPLAINFQWFGQDPEVEPLAREYLLILTLGTFPMLASLGAKNFADGLSHTRPAMVITLIGVLVNVMLNWLFIYGNWGFPAWGLNGAAFSTVIARLFIFICISVYVFRSKLFADYRRVSMKISLTSKQFIEIFKIGIPSGLQYFFEVGAFASASLMAGWLGKSQSAAHQVAITLASVTYTVCLGISAAASIRVGAAYGENNGVAARRSGNAALIMALSFMAFTALLFFSLQKFLPIFFTQNETVITYAASLLAITALFQLFDGAQCIGLGILRGFKDVKKPTIYTLVAYWAIGLPSAYLFGFIFKGDVQGIWYGLTLGLMVSAVLLYIRFRNIASHQISA